MPKGSTFANDFLKLIFLGTPIANLADNAATAALTSLYLGLATADPTAAGNQTSNEATYTGYGRVALVRSASGWTVTGNSVSPLANVDWPIGSAGSGTATFLIIGTALTGTGKLLFSMSVSPGIIMGNGITPRITPASALTET